MQHYEWQWFFTLQFQNSANVSSQKMTQVSPREARGQPRWEISTHYPFSYRSRFKPVVALSSEDCTLRESSNRIPSNLPDKLSSVRWSNGQVCSSVKEP
jgi:hypothetical protein